MSGERKAEAEIGGVRLTSPDKVLYPEQGITKRDLAEYYLAVAAAMLPHVARRPITLVRCPTGRQRKCFYQRHAGSGVPSELAEVDIPGFEESGAYLFIKDARGSSRSSRWACSRSTPGARASTGPTARTASSSTSIPARASASRTSPRRRTRCARSSPISASRASPRPPAARACMSCCRSTGATPIRRSRRSPRRSAEAIAAETPTRYLTRISIAERRGRIFIDYLRNDATSTAVAPYSTRARAGAPVATPVSWDELTPGLDPAAFSIRTVPGRLKNLGADPWADMGKVRQGLPAALRGW